ncbi:hypothetical protein BV898_19638 [Hypsibius exemplaris]|uniref:Uncharacterized protein n=1 Tax=Hypsibius exemplaris TaxID=2072580 RepID=A0A9X6RPU0_HYPEX|nr:hypothetical protein BV898_19638 [Hypsibius exemplaris]
MNRNDVADHILARTRPTKLFSFLFHIHHRTLVLRHDEADSPLHGCVYSSPTLLLFKRKLFRALLLRPMRGSPSLVSTPLLSLPSCYVRTRDIINIQ